MYAFSTLYMTNILSLAITMCYLMCWPSFTGIMMLIRRPADWGGHLLQQWQQLPGQGLVTVAPALSELQTNPTRKVAGQFFGILHDI